MRDDELNDFVLQSFADRLYPKFPFGYGYTPDELKEMLFNFFCKNLHPTGEQWIIYKRYCDKNPPPSGKNKKKVYMPIGMRTPLAIWTTLVISVISIKSL